MSGIRGRVDGDIAFYDYPKIIREANLNHLDENEPKYKIGDKVFVTGDIYENSKGEVVKAHVCDEEFTIECIASGEVAPYKISEGYVKEDSIYLKK